MIRSHNNIYFTLLINQMSNVSFIELTFLMHMVGNTISGFIRNLFDFILSSFLITRIMHNDNNYNLVQSLCKYVIKNRTNFQSECYTLMKSRDNITGFHLEGQKPRLSAGITFFWHNNNLYWAICDSNTSRSHYNVKLCGFRWCSKDMDLLLQEISKNIDPPKLYIYFDGYWQDNININPLTDKTYISDGNTLKQIDEHINKFINSKEKYEDLEQRYKTGILLYGPAGTGKTSIPIYIAHKYKRDVYVLYASDLDQNDDISEVINDIPPNCILLLDDFDGAESLSNFHMKSSNVCDDSDNEDNKDAIKKKIKSNAEAFTKKLQSTFDGFHSPNNGLIYFIITNHIDKIDPILIRPGRIDLQVEFKYASDAWLRKYLLKEYPGCDDDATLLCESLKDIDIPHSEINHKFMYERQKTSGEMVNLIVEHFKKAKVD